jgi:hydrogenase/urease accessory protein HupE
MYTSLDTQGRLSARLLSAQARSACLFFLLLLLFYSQGAYARRGGRRQRVHPGNHRGEHHPVYLLTAGAKHMVTGYDHLLFLFG